MSSSRLTFRQLMTDWIKHHYSTIETVDYGSVTIGYVETRRDRNGMAIVMFESQTDGPPLRLVRPLSGLLPKEQEHVDIHDPLLLEKTIGHLKEIFNLSMKP